jgi:hypothetical protein
MYLIMLFIMPRNHRKFESFFGDSPQCGFSLNKEILQDPDLKSSLIGVVTRFRQEVVAIMADKESKFYQVKIPQSQYDYLSFVWWPKGDVNGDLVDYPMRMHFFSVISSPSPAL